MTKTGENCQMEMTIFRGLGSFIGKYTVMDLTQEDILPLIDRYLFKVGGRGKKFTQIADIPDSYLAVDGVETGYGARIPLYMFGLLY